MPLVCDMTSSMGTKTLDVSKYGVIFGSVQKNLGPSGCCICIVRDDLIGIQRKNTPQMFSWQDNLAFKSIVNTPPVINTYMTGLVIDFLNQTGGTSVYEQQSIVRQKLVYDVIDSSHGFYTPRVKQDDGRSRLNIVFYLKDEQLTQQFITEAGKIGLIELKGHASTGGIRVSMYNGMPLSGVQKLRDFMLQFQQEHQQ